MLLGRRGHTDVEALGRLAAERADVLELVGLLDALDDDGDAEGLERT